MPLEQLSSAEALHNVRRNRVSIWPDGRLATGRMGVFANCLPSPSFTFTADDAFFTMGSCFAREIEKFILQTGLKAPMTALSLPQEERISGTANEILNKYTPFAMLNELRWALTGETPADEHLYLLADAENDLWVDPHLHPELKPAPLARLKERRADVLELTRSILSTRIIVLTLGLIEAWYDTHSGLYLNGSPPKTVLSREPERFQLHVLSYEDVMKALNEIYGLIQKYCRQDTQILVTVSPVPFKATFTGRDAMAANTYSKSVLRTAAESFVRAHDNVDYFPSYEIVTLSDRAGAYWVDNIHVRPEMVARIMNQVFRSYLPERAEEFAKDAFIARDEDRSGPALYKKAINFLRQEAPVDAAQNLQMAIDTYGADGLGVSAATALSDLGISYLRSSNTALGLKYLQQSLELEPENGRIWYKLGLAHARLKDSDSAISAFFKALETIEDKDSVKWRLGVEYHRREEWQKAYDFLSQVPETYDSKERIEQIKDKVKVKVKVKKVKS
ncbi:MAG: GSCFA domain-containing protein [Asticcacaulis sp.]